MAENERAHFVCLICSSRKKACDKALPACGPCVKRGLSCKYDDSGKREKASSTYNPGKHFVASDTWSSPSSQASAANSSWSAYSNWTASPATMSSSASVSQSIHNSLNQQVQEVMNFTNLTAEDISQVYFRSFHRLYPIISPELFQRVASKYAQAGHAAPSTDYSILILAMFLGITLPGHYRHSAFSLTGQERLYVRIKSLLAQVQSSISPSLAFVQVMFVLTIWEYTRARPEAAYSSINTCASMARILGIGNELLEQPGEHHCSTNLDLVEIERRNVAWAIALLERIILVEMNNKNIRPLTRYPDLYCQLPLDLLPSDSSLRPSINYQTSMLATLSFFEAGYVSWFGRQAQAIFLLDRVLDIVRSISKNHDIQAVLDEATELEIRIHTFLMILLEESRQQNTSLCSAVAFSIRASFLLHWTLLDTLSSSENVDSDQVRNLSWTALNSACNMTIDAITNAAANPDAAVPICSFYILQDSIRYLSNQQRILGEEATIGDLTMLSHADEEYRRTYVF